MREDFAGEADKAGGDDEELRRRIAAWKADRLGVSSDDVHAWMRAKEASLDAPPPAPERTR